MNDQPKTKKVRLIIEAEVDEVEGFTDEEYAKVAVGMLSYILYGASSFSHKDRRFVVSLEEGRVLFSDPRPILGTHEIIEDDDGVYLLG